MDRISDITMDSFAGALYFPTIIFSIQCAQEEELNSYLINLIYNERTKDRMGIQRSNYKQLGGWHSKNSLHRDVVFGPIIQRINQAGKRISEHFGYDPNKQLHIDAMWSIINPPGSSNKVHIHPNCLWSGVYYVQAPADSGHIEFVDPRTCHVMTEPSFDRRKKRQRETWTKVSYAPKAGKMLIFPSWLYHGVDPNLSQLTDSHADRVILSFNLCQR